MVEADGVDVISADDTVLDIVAKGDRIGAREAIVPHFLSGLENLFYSI